MKRIILLAVLLFCIVGCASAAPSEPASKPEAPAQTIEVKEPEESIFDKSLARNEEFAQIERSHPIAGTGNESADLNFADFDFYNEILANGIPEGAYWPIIREMPGTWKYMLQVRQDSSGKDMYFDELGYADFVIDYDREIISLSLHPRLASDGYEVWEESDEEVGYKPFEGLPENNGIKLIGNDCVLWIGEYYAYEGREYVYGELYMSEENYAVFLMTRGQQ